MSLRLKLLLPFFVFLISSILFLQSIWLPKYIASEKKELLHQEQEYLELLSSMLLPDILVGDLAKIYETLDAILTKHSHWHSIVLKNHDGQRLYPIEMKDRAGSGQLFSISYKLGYREKILADLKAEMNFDTLISKKVSKIQMMALTIFGFLAIMAIFSIFFQELFIRKPLAKLAKACTEIASGRYEVKLFQASKDEIGRFSLAFDNMRTRLKTREEELASSQKRMAAIIENSIESIVTINTKGVILSANMATEKIFGYRQADLLGKKINTLMPEPYCYEHDRYIKKYLETDEARILGTGREVKGQKKDGTVFPIWISAVEVSLEDERLFTGIIMDITRQKNAQEELRQHRDNLQQMVTDQTREILAAKEAAEKASHAKSSFLANMSHEIRTPLNAVLGFLSLAMEHKDLAPDLLEHLRTSYSSAKSLLVLLNDILDISKLESGKVIIENKPFCLTKLLKDIFSTMDITAREKSLKFSMSSSGIPECCIGDSTRLRQILINLLGNAIKFTLNGSVALTIEAIAEEHFHFSVHDTGIGIAPDRIESIFSPFTQEDSSTTRKFGGTGLGTTISKDLVELMDGKIWVKSKVGEGTAFHFTVRLALTDCVKTCIDQRVNEPGYIGLKRKFNILVAEDIEENAKLVTIRLKSQGQMLTVARDGKEAVAAFKRGGYDLILMDVQMPEMDGLTATRIIRNIEAETGGHIPIIAMTASVMRNDIESCLNAGVDSFVGKPIDFEKLFSAIERVVPDDSGLPFTKDKIIIQERGGKKTELAQCKGIDTEAGVRNWQDPDVYFDALIGFADKYDDVVDTLRSHLEERNIDAAYAISHSLKGVSGNLFIKDVYQSVEKFEAALKNRQMNNINRFLDELEELLSEAVKAIRCLDTGRPEGISSPIIKDYLNVRPQLLDLLARLDTDDPDKIEPVLDQLKSLIPSDIHVSLSEKVGNFDFREAEKEIDNLLKQIPDTEQ